MCLDHLEHRLLRGLGQVREASSAGVDDAVAAVISAVDGRVVEQRAHARLHALGRQARLVPALERHNHLAVGERAQLRRHRRVPRRTECHAANAVAFGGIEASRDEHQLRRKLARDWHHDQLKGGQVLGISHAFAAPRHIHRKTFSFTFPDIFSCSGPREEPAAIAMKRDVEHARVFAENLLSAVPVMHVPVNYEHARNLHALDGSSRRDRDVVQETKAAHFRRACMMSWRAHNSEAAAELPLNYTLRQLQHSACCKPCSPCSVLIVVHVAAPAEPAVPAVVLRSAKSRRVLASPCTSKRWRCVSQRVQSGAVLFGMHGEGLSPLSFSCRNKGAAVQKRRAMKSSPDQRCSFGCLNVRICSCSPSRRGMHAHGFMI
mmetsp:Transcript_25572/g.55977  ORF Transcript_25572/g.55977 Transcript_25572/m.55977 type:complete len:376 (-) Transcript_25572:159-1286(-)